MTVDPNEPETFEADTTEATVTLDEETPEADAAEQHTELQQRTDDPLTRIDPSVANEADAAEQTRVVTMDEDDYR
ncbi:hypothetical protein [Streptomyces sp. CB03238]|uniref:hypothetical protein n=1 Tax=Streptomyces sp. CB03238 TaxID=1907777 RepID=UPI000A11240A|nr:hypothetical protein [Streptomyces sp. CB03238]ORT61227.1 hypothetical protein BKD26_03925 [Streptomyces sp. CB03238]